MQTPLSRSQLWLTKRLQKRRTGLPIQPHLVCVALLQYDMQYSLPLRSRSPHNAQHSTSTSIRAPFRRNVRSLVPRLLPPSLKLLSGRREEPGNGAMCVDGRAGTRRSMLHTYNYTIDRRARAVRGSRDRIYD